MIAPILVDGVEVQAPLAPVLNPARTSEVVGEYAMGGTREADLAVEAARAAFPSWSALPATERASYLRKAADAIETEVDRLAVLITREVGKVLPESHGDVAGAPSLLRYFASLAERIDAETAVEVAYSGRAAIRHAPMGPVVVIAPWNTPVYLAFMALAPALMAGNTVVVKPPEEAPLALSEVLGLLARTLPRGVVGSVPGLGREAGAALTAHPAVRKVLFTGSIATGREVMRSAAATIKNVGMELGGNDAALVLRDAEIGDATVRELVAGVFGLSGQICYNVKRIYVHADRFTEFVDAFTALTARIVVGDGLDPRSTIGPVTTRAGYERVLGLRDEAAASGAKVAVVGTKLDPAGWDKGHFILPSIVTGLDPEAPLVADEQFGPVIPILPFSTEDEAVRLANDSEFGLAASVWSTDTERAWALARRLEAGSAFINVHRVGASPMSVPFGGFKQSGLGRNHGLESVFSCMEPQAVVQLDDAGEIPGTARWNTLLEHRDV
ncbi:aldehyde dehydrogenase [Actinocorallia herbida]|uniref:Aldehyde dehydrogenase n=1 Tax=Actinocorallia herbida TaxID=58109 RepID=A0A3N1D278_9ACTN|nr:aldehyde dehydrogenase family protein [Actinocorallia herbida]ROO87590.1 aldehyde dehydrogenase [Actinocorallia herbida]